MFLNKEFKFDYSNFSEIDSLILFGSYSRNEQTKFSDIDVLIISEKSKGLKDKIYKLNKKIEPIILSKEEFKEKVLEFNKQLIPIFYEGKIILDKENYFYKMRNLFLALFGNKSYSLRIKNKVYELKKLKLKYGG
jgi:predicted nucleotidyltransferase